MFCTGSKFSALTGFQIKHIPDTNVLSSEKYRIERKPVCSGKQPYKQGQPCLSSPIAVCKKYRNGKL